MEGLRGSGSRLQNEALTSKKRVITNSKIIPPKKVSGSKSSSAKGSSSPPALLRADPKSPQVDNPRIISPMRSESPEKSDITYARLGNKESFSSPTKAKVRSFLKGESKKASVSPDSKVRSLDLPHQSTDQGSSKSKGSKTFSNFKEKLKNNSLPRSRIASKSSATSKAASNVTNDIKKKTQIGKTKVKDNKSANTAKNESKKSIPTANEVKVQSIEKSGFGKTSGSDHANETGNCSSNKSFDDNFKSVTEICKDLTSVEGTAACTSEKCPSEDAGSSTTGGEVLTQMTNNNQTTVWNNHAQTLPKDFVLTPWAKFEDYDWDAEKAVVTHESSDDNSQIICEPSSPKDIENIPINETVTENKASENSFNDMSIDLENQKTNKHLQNLNDDVNSNTHSDNERKNASNKKESSGNNDLNHSKGDGTTHKENQPVTEEEDSTDVKSYPPPVAPLRRVHTSNTQKDSRDAVTSLPPEQLKEAMRSWVSFDEQCAKRDNCKSNKSEIVPATLSKENKELKSGHKDYENVWFGPLNRKESNDETTPFDDEKCDEEFKVYGSVRPFGDDGDASSVGSDEDSFAKIIEEFLGHEVSVENDKSFSDCASEKTELDILGPAEEVMQKPMRFDRIFKLSIDIPEVWETKYCDVRPHHFFVNIVTQPFVWESGSVIPVLKHDFEYALCRFEIDYKGVASEILDFRIYTFCLPLQEVHEEHIPGIVSEIVPLEFESLFPLYVFSPVNEYCEAEIIANLVLQDFKIPKCTPVYVAHSKIDAEGNDLHMCVLAETDISVCTTEILISQIPLLPADTVMHPSLPSSSLSLALENSLRDELLKETEKTEGFELMPPNNKFVNEVPKCKGAGVQEDIITPVDLSVVKLQNEIVCDLNTAENNYPGLLENNIPEEMAIGNELSIDFKNRHQSTTDSVEELSDEVKTQQRENLSLYHAMESIERVELESVAQDVTSLPELDSGVTFVESAELLSEKSADELGCRIPQGNGGDNTIFQGHDKDDTRATDKHNEPPCLEIPEILIHAPNEESECHAEKSQLKEQDRNVESIERNCSSSDLLQASERDEEESDYTSDMEGIPVCSLAEEEMLRALMYASSEEATQDFIDVFVMSNKQYQLPERVQAKVTRVEKEPLYHAIIEEEMVYFMTDFEPLGGEYLNSFKGDEKNKPLNENPLEVDEEASIYMCESASPLVYTAALEETCLLAPDCSTCQESPVLPDVVLAVQSVEPSQLNVVDLSKLDIIEISTDSENIPLSGPSASNIQSDIIGSTDDEIKQSIVSHSGLKISNSANDLSLDTVYNDSVKNCRVSVAQEEGMKNDSLLCVNSEDNSESRSSSCNERELIPINTSICDTDTYSSGWNNPLMSSDKAIQDEYDIPTFSSFHKPTSPLSVSLLSQGLPAECGSFKDTAKDVDSIDNSAVLQYWAGVMKEKRICGNIGAIANFSLPDEKNQVDSNSIPIPKMGWHSKEEKEITNICRRDGDIDDMIYFLSCSPESVFDGADFLLPLEEEEDDWLKDLENIDEEVEAFDSEFEFGEMELDLEKDNYSVFGKLSPQGERKRIENFKKLEGKVRMKQEGSPLELSSRDGVPQLKNELSSERGWLMDGIRHTTKGLYNLFFYGQTPGNKREEGNAVTEGIEVAESKDGRAETSHQIVSKVSDGNEGKDDHVFVSVTNSGAYKTNDNSEKSKSSYLEMTQGAIPKVQPPSDAMPEGGSVQTLRPFEGNNTVTVTGKAESAEKCNEYSLMGDLEDQEIEDIRIFAQVAEASILEEHDREALRLLLTKVLQVSLLLCVLQSAVCCAHCCQYCWRVLANIIIVAISYASLICYFYIYIFYRY